jgi:hypothetical protein
MFPLIRFNPNTQLLFYFLIKKQLFSASLLQESKSKFPRQILATSAKNVGDYSPVQSTAFLKRALSIGPLFDQSESVDFPVDFLQRILCKLISLPNARSVRVFPSGKRLQTYSK